MRDMLLPVVKNHPELSIADIWLVRLGSKVTIQHFVANTTEVPSIISLDRYRGEHALFSDLSSESQDFRRQVRYRVRRWAHYPSQFWTH